VCALHWFERWLELWNGHRFQSEVMESFNTELRDPRFPSP